jgi:hypothetical protein
MDLSNIEEHLCASCNKSSESKSNLASTAFWVNIDERCRHRFCDKCYQKEFSIKRQVPKLPCLKMHFFPLLYATKSRKLIWFFLHVPAVRLSALQAHSEQAKCKHTRHVFGAEFCNSFNID